MTGQFIISSSFLQYCYRVMDLNKIINERIGMGSYQVKALLILSLIDIAHGAEVVINSLLNPIFKVSVQGATTSFISTLASAFYVGILLGCILCGYCADRYGRKSVIQAGSILQIISAVLFCVTNSTFFLFVLRFFYGFAFGFTLAVITSLYAEIAPEAYRAKGILFLNFSAIFGKLFAVLLGYMFIRDNLGQTNWKLMIVCGAIPNLLVLLGSHLILRESPRYLLSMQRFQEAIDVLNQMIVENKGKQSPLITAQEQQLIKQEYESEESQDQQISFAALFRNGNLRKVLTLGWCWMVINFCFFGQLTVEALHISKPHVPLRDGLTKYFWMVLGEMPSLLLTFMTIDHPLFGRKNSLAFFFLGAGMFYLLFGLTALTSLGSIARFFMKDVFQVVYPLTTEAFETKVRVKGYGFCSGLGRIGGIIMPLVLIPLDEWSHEGVYVCFFALSVISSLIVGWLIEQTMYKSLDEVKKEGTRLQLDQ